ncbi:MAG: glycosyltransferase family 4 protein [Chloroflexi bacterium]|nr:glycosyltransferase family 4 protein [Chloroflexota bacterium]
MRVGSAIFGSLKKVGGYQVFAYNLLKGLAERGHSVTLFVPGEERSRNRAFYNTLPFRAKALPRPSNTLARYFPMALRSYIRYQNTVNRFDIWQIVGSYPAAYIVSTLAGKVPLVLRAYGDDIQKDAGLSYGLRLDRRIEPIIVRTLKKMDRVVALTETIAESYRELDVPLSRIVEIPNGVDSARFSAVSDTAATRRAWQVPSEATLLLTVGRHHQKKGYDSIPRIARILKDQGLSFIWLIVGAGTQQLDGLIRDAQVADFVKTHPAVQISDAEDGLVPKMPADRLVELYQAADIFVFPSLLEGFPRVLIEAMAAGVPVITTDAPGCREVVEHLRTGMVGAAGDDQAIAGHVKELIDDGGLRRRLGDNGLAEARKYDWETVVGQYEDLYRSLVSQTGLVESP